MSDTVHWVLELSVKPGKLDGFKALMAEMVEATQANEPDTTHYEWFISADEQSVHIYERYRDSAAVMTHMTTFGDKYAERFLDAVQPSRFVVYGNPSEEVMNTLGPIGAVHMPQIGGFAR